jgi:hypothetical protein
MHVILFDQVNDISWSPQVVVIWYEDGELEHV